MLWRNRDIQVDPQDFDIQKVLSVTIEGGNGTGAIFEPVLSKEIEKFLLMEEHYLNAGGVDNVNETITFFNRSSYYQVVLPLTYDKNGNDPLGIGTVGNDGLSVVGLGTTTLVDKSNYIL